MDKSREETRSQPRHALRLWILAAFLFYGLAGCGSPSAQAPVVGEPKVSPSTPVKPGDQVGIGVDVTNTDNTTLTYSWTADGGKILRGDGSPIITYEAPAEPGIYNVKVEVKWGNQSMVKNASIKVEPPPTSQPQLSTVPTTQSQPTTPPSRATEPPGQQSTTASLPATQPPATGPVTLTTHQEGQSYPCETLARGTYSPEQIKGHIWVLVSINRQYWPQDEGGDAPPMRPDGTWFSTIRIGGCDTDRDVGKTFQLFVVEADDAAHQAFLDWLEHGKQTGDFPGIVTENLPKGIKEYIGPIFVTRK